ncbi:hypothetical protein TYRP_013231 [Tyrophagus putrescentiae]|nr:hypothetical protein TYRP_013231 [Tyrophagus putrescentiae]
MANKYPITTTTTVANPYTFADYLLEYLPLFNSALFDHLTDYFADFFINYDQEEEEAKKKGGKLLLSAVAVTNRLRIEQNAEQCLYLQLGEVHRRHHRRRSVCLQKKTSLNGSTPTNGEQGLNGLNGHHHPLSDQPDDLESSHDTDEKFMYPWQDQHHLLMMDHLGVPLTNWARARRCTDCDRLLRALYETSQQKRRGRWAISSQQCTNVSFRFPVALYHRLEKVLGLKTMSERSLLAHLARYGRHRESSAESRDEMVLSNGFLHHCQVARVKIWDEEVSVPEMVKLNTLH